MPTTTVVADSVGMASLDAECSAGCGRFSFETDANTASCIDSATPPTVCPRTVAKTQAGLKCIKFKSVTFTCGVDQPCLRDEKDDAGSLTCGDCKDEDNDGYSTCDGDCDDSDTPEGFNTNPGAEEICGNNRNDNCDSQVDEEPCCSPDDNDGDGVSGCDGDCNDDDPTDSNPPVPRDEPVTDADPAGGDGHALRGGLPGDVRAALHLQ